MWSRVVLLVVLNICVASLQKTGGLSKVEPNDDHYELARISLKQYLQDTSSDQDYQVVLVTEASEQVVAGTNTKLKFLVSATNCSLDEDGEPSDDVCEVLKKSDRYPCESKVFTQSWTNYREVSEVCCDFS